MDAVSGRRAVHPDQLVLLALEEEPAAVSETPGVSGRIRNDAGVASGRSGAARLLRDLVRAGLPDVALPAAAALVIELDAAAESRREAAA